MLRRALTATAMLCFLTLCASAETLRVMTFNVRYPATGDGHNRWELRKDTLVRTIALKNPDVLGTQELFYVQGEYIAENLPEYEWFGNSRRGTREDEHMGVFYKRHRLRLIESGNFWLSETPEVPGSQAWGATLPRMVTWALFEVKADGKRFYFYNTHFQHRREEGAESRLNSADLIAQRIAMLPKEVPLILVGDFNDPPRGKPHTILANHLTDAWETAHRRLGPQGTSSRFSGFTEGQRIDWILYRGPYTVLEAETVTYNEEGRYPSDHYPVLVVLEY